VLRNGGYNLPSIQIKKLPSCFGDINISRRTGVHSVGVMRCEIPNAKYKTARLNTHEGKSDFRIFLTQISESPMLFAEQLGGHDYSALLLIDVKLIYMR